MNNMFFETKASWDEHVANINTKYKEEHTCTNRN